MPSIMQYQVYYVFLSHQRPLEKRSAIVYLGEDVRKEPIFCHRKQQPGLRHEGNQHYQW